MSNYDYLEKCPICGKQVKTVISIKNRDIIGMASEYTQDVGFCRNCGFIFTQNPFSDEQFKNRYSNYSKFEFDDNEYFLDESESYKKRCYRQKEFIKRTIDYNDFDSILEIGAASGFNLSIYSDKQTYGIEPSKQNVDNAKKYYNIKMFCGMFEEFNKQFFGEGVKYNLVFSSMSLEHIVNPLKFIQTVSHYCDKYMFIEVPTFDYKISNEPFGMFCEEHVNMFTLESLQKLMNVCGYQLIDVDFIFSINETLPAGYPSMSTLWKKTNLIKPYIFVNNSEIILHRYIEDSKQILDKIDKCIDSVSDKERLAIWGTGHHASMLYENTCLKNKHIVKIFDSDKKKTGLCMFNCTIEPFDEKYIVYHEIDCILVATYTAMKPISKILEKYSNEIKIILLYEINNI